jgi:hypothetical protein
MLVALSRLLHRLGLRRVARLVRPTPPVGPLGHVPGVPDLRRPTPEDVRRDWLGEAGWVNQREYGRPDPSRGQARPE